MDWARELEALGIPADRICLVERNAELKGKLKARGNAIQGIREVHHETFEHAGTLDCCENGVCAGLREILKITEGS